MEAIFKALWKALMLMIKAFFMVTLGYNISDGCTLKCWSLSIKDFELASTPKKNVLPLRWTTKNSLFFKSLNCVSYKVRFV